MSRVSRAIGARAHCRPLLIAWSTCTKPALSRRKRASDVAGDMRRWLLENKGATFATISVDARCRGYPFCSIVPFALDARGRPLLQLASIAQHTKNIESDPRASLFVHQRAPGDSDGAAAADPQAGWRITLVGTARRVPAEERDEAVARIAERVPRALEYERTHDFAPWRLDIEHVRYIGGFGRICWLAGADVLRDPLAAGLAAAAPGAIAHMNEDHRTSMIDMCTGLYGFTPERAEMLALDRAGMLVKTTAPERLVWFSFGREIDAGALRGAVVDVVKRARAAVAK